MNTYAPSIAEMRRAATLHDWVDDFPFWGGYILHTCQNCNSTFHSFAMRGLCRACTPVTEDAPCSGS